MGKLKKIKLLWKKREDIILGSVMVLSIYCYLLKKCIATPKSKEANNVDIE